MIAALRRADADAVWLGWGFIAESASFAQACEKAGIVFVGPDSETIRLLGDKVAAKRVAEQVGVPVVPWSGAPVDDLTEATRHAAHLGYPVIVKAAAGGGGRGIRVVRDDAELAAALPVGARRSGAGVRRSDGISRAADTGCAARRGPGHRRRARHRVGARRAGLQPPAPSSEGHRGVGVDRTRRRDGAGDPRSRGPIGDRGRLQERRHRRVPRLPGRRRFMFMEVNARLQVEHPVTEMTTGADLVKLQLHVASGGRLGGPPPRRRGHAVEARLCAEDPENGFVPSPGRIAMLALPAGTGIRVDTGVREGDVVSPEFDSMIAKVIAWGRDRDEALARLCRALRADGGRRRGRYDQPVVPADAARPARGAAGTSGQPMAGPADRQRRICPTRSGRPAAGRGRGVRRRQRPTERKRPSTAGRARKPGTRPTSAMPASSRTGAYFRLRVYRTGPSSLPGLSGGALADITVDSA